MSDRETPDSTPNPVESQSDGGAVKPVETAAANKQHNNSPEEHKASRHHSNSSKSDRLASTVEPMGENCPADQIPAKKPKTEESKSAGSFLSSAAPQQQTQPAAVLPGLSAASYLQGLGFPPYPTLFEPGTNNPFLHSAFGFQADTSHKAQQESFLKSLSGNGGVSSTSNSSGAANNIRMTNGQTHKSESGESQSESQSAGLTVANLTVEEVVSLKSLVVGYREAAALLLKSAEEIENLLESSGRK